LKQAEAQVLHSLAPIRLPTLFSAPSGWGQRSRFQKAEMLDFEELNAL